MSSSSTPMECEQLRKELAQCKSALYETKLLLDEQNQWLNLVSDDKIFKATHLLVRITRQLRSGPYERKLFWRWLRHKGDSKSKFNYIYHIQNLRDRANTILGRTRGSSCETLDSLEQEYQAFQRKKDLYFSFENVLSPRVQDLVSIVLPVYNGGSLLDEAVQSVLAQTYTNFELIIVDDGSTDNTPTQVDRWAARDARIHVLHQQNQKIPRALNHGFALARGEFLTWTSADNIMHPDFLSRMVEYLKRHTDVALCYANMRLIDEAGAPIQGNTWFPKPDEPEVVAFPPAEISMNAHGENLIGAAFFYRGLVKDLIGGYDPSLYTVEDFDYWLRINDFFALRHVDFDDAIYDYRLHGGSLTSKAKELRINETKAKLMRLERGRQNVVLTNLCWFVQSEDGRAQWEAAAARHGHILVDFDAALPQEYCVTVMFRKESHRENGSSYQAFFKMGLLQNSLADSYDLHFVIGETSSASDNAIHVKDWDTAFRLAQIFVKSKMIADRETHLSADAALDASVVIYQAAGMPMQALEKSLGAALHQTAARRKYEILVISEETPAGFSAQPGSACDRLIHSPFQTPEEALDLASNTCRGKILLFVTTGTSFSKHAVDLITRDFCDDRYAAMILAESSSSSSGYERIDQETLSVPTNLFAVNRMVCNRLGGFPARLFPDSAAFWKHTQAFIRRSGYEIGSDPRLLDNS